MSNQDYDHKRAERFEVLFPLSALAVFGCFLLLTGTLVAQFVVPGHDWIADTVSDLGAGRWEIIMDVSLYGFAAGLMAIALSASHAHLGGNGWSIGVASFAILATLVIIIAARNEYGDGDSEGVVIHIYLVYGLGVFFLLGPLCLAEGLRAEHPTSRWILIAFTMLWGISAPVFFFLPTNVDGLYERILGLIACCITITLAYVFAKRSRHAYRKQGQ